MVNEPVVTRRDYWPPWERNWLCYRQSKAEVWRRHDKGDTAPVCAVCGCEIDIVPVPHSPRCSQ